MKELNIQEFKDLIHLIAPLRALKDDIEKNMHLESYHGTSKLVVRSYRSLQGKAATITEDDYVQALDIDVEEGMEERELVAQVLTAGVQLLAYLESLTGIPGSDHKHTSIQTAPYIILNANGTTAANQAKAMELVQQATKQTPDT